MDKGLLMEFTTLKLQLNAMSSTREMMAKYYIQVRLHHYAPKWKMVKQIVNLDEKGNATLHFEGVDVISACLRFQVFKHHIWLPDKLIYQGAFYVSSLTKGGRKFNEEAIFQNGSWTPNRTVIRLSCKLSLPEMPQPLQVHPSAPPFHDDKDTLCRTNPSIKGQLSTVD